MSTTTVKHLSTAALEAGLDTIRQAPKDNGVLELIVRRPMTDQREVLEEGRLDLAEGLVGDNWRGSWQPGHLRRRSPSRDAAQRHERACRPPWSPRNRNAGPWRGTNSMSTWT